MLYEYREILPEHLPPGDHQDLMNQGIFEIAPGIYQCICGAPDNRGQHPAGTKLPGHRLGVTGVSRHRLLPKDVRAAVLHARVMRHADRAASLRHLVNDNDDPERLRAGVPARGGSRKPANEAKALASLGRAKGFVESGEAETLLVPMMEVQDGDVVEIDALPAMRFAGETG